MDRKINFFEIAPEVVGAIRGLERSLRTSGLEKALLELVRLRASYLNGCAYCVDMHTKDARAQGETEQRLYALPVWRETPFFTPRERAALAWTEAVTLLPAGGDPSAIREEVLAQFTEEELVRLTTAVVAINSWNRLVVPLGAEVGSYRPGDHAGDAAGRSGDVPARQ
jgi:AhpD family alkylhydroperoxidase